MKRSNEGQKGKRKVVLTLTALVFIAAAYMFLQGAVRLVAEEAGIDEMWVVAIILLFTGFVIVKWLGFREAMDEILGAKPK